MNTTRMLSLFPGDSPDMIFGMSIKVFNDYELRIQEVMIILGKFAKLNLLMTRLMLNRQLAS